MNTKEPLIKQGWLRVLLFCIAFLIVQIVASFGVAMLLVLLNQSDDIKSAGEFLQNATIASLAIVVCFSFIVSFLLVYLFRRFIDRNTIYALGWKFSGFQSHALTGLLAGIASLGIGTFILIALKNLRFTGWNIDGEEIFISFGLMIIVAISEELVFRGYILNNLMQSTNRYAALFISALLFGLAHNANPNFSWLAFVNIFLAGIFLGINYIYTQNLWYAMALHFSWNFFQGPVLGYEVSGTNLSGILQHELSGNELITGGKFGFEASIVATGVMIVFIVILALVYSKKEKAKALSPATV